MSLRPEFQVLAINAVILGIAYFAVYPRIPNVTVMKMARNDIILTGLALLVAGALFWNTDQIFSLLLFSANWFWFSLLTLAIMELPLFMWFCHRNGLSLSPEE